MKENQSSQLWLVFLAALAGLLAFFFEPQSRSRAPASAPASSSTDDFERERIARLPQSPSRFEARKVVISDLDIRGLARSQNIAPPRTSGAQTILPMGTRLALIVDNSCEPRSSGGRVLGGTFWNSREKKPLRFETISLEMREGLSLTAIEEDVADENCVVGVGLEGKVSKNGVYDDPGSSSQYQLSSVGALASENFFFRSSLIAKQKVKVAIVDTGVDYNHPDLASHIWTNPQGGKGYDFAYSDGDPMDDDGHGTHVAGLVGAASNGEGVTGINPRDVEIMAIKVLDSSGEGTYADVANGIRYAADNGAQVINLSLSGSGASSVVEDALIYAINKGALITMAAGNDGIRIDQGSSFLTPASYAASLNGAISVLSVDSQTHRRSSFSNYGVGVVEIAAPGQSGIYSTLPNRGYGYKNGTSMASPLVAGAASLVIVALRTQNFYYTPADVKQILINGSVQNTNLTNFVTNGAELNLPELARLLDANYLVNFNGQIRGDL